MKRTRTASRDGVRAAEPLAETIGSTIRIVPPSSASSAAPAFDLSGRTPEQDFYERNGYRWDWIMAVRLRPPRSVPVKIREIIKALMSAGLTVDSDFDRCGYVLFIKIGADVERLAHHADAIDYKMLADPAVLQLIAKDGVSVEEGLERPIEPFLIGHDPKVTGYRPVDFIYLPYEQSEPKCQWFYRQRRQPHPFRTIHRIKLIKSIITQERVDGDRVCGLNVRGLIAEKTIDGFYPVHDKGRVDELLRYWIYSPWSVPWDLPIPRIRAYFGEKVTLYFAFVGHYSTWLLAPALLGIIPFSLVASRDFRKEAYDNPVCGLYALFIALWAVFMLEFWKRKQKRYNLEWGMHGYEEREAVRPEFDGDLAVSLKHDRLEKQYPLSFYRAKLGLSGGAVTLMMCVVVAVVVSIFAIRFAIERTEASAYAASLASMLNSVQITVLNAVYCNVALALNHWENHRTDTQYQDALITKLFAFQFVNSYSSMAYIAFVQPYDTVHPCPNNNNCIGSLANNLTIIFLTRLVVGNMTGVIIPLVRNLCKEWQHGKVSGEIAELEKQFKMIHYDPIMDLLFDYANIAITYGFAVLFVMANPIVPLLALVSSYIEIRGDGFKLLKIHRRPEPVGVEDIGVWQTVFTFITFVSIVSNSALIAFTTDTFDGPYVNAFWLFYILQLLGFATSALFREVIPDVPVAVQIQVERTEFWHQRVMLQAKEDEDEEQMGATGAARMALEPEDVLPENWTEPLTTAKTTTTWEDEAVAAVTGDNLSMIITSAAVRGR